MVAPLSGECLPDPAGSDHCEIHATSSWKIRLPTNTTTTETNVQLVTGVALHYKV